MLEHTEEKKSDLKQMILSELKADYSFNLFCLLPGIDSRQTQIHRNARRLGISDEEIFRFENMLIEAGLWVRDSDEIDAQFDLLDFGDITIKDYLSLTVCIVSQLSSEKPYEYDTLSLATSRAHIKKFIKTVNIALKDLYQNSKEDSEDKNCIFSWTHMGVIELESKTKSQYWESK